jgi:hypothetical protein
MHYRTKTRSPYIAGLIALPLFALIALLGCSDPTLPVDPSGPPFKVTYYNTKVNTTGSVPVDSTLYPSGATVTVMGNSGNLYWGTSFTFIGWNTKDNGGLYGGGGGTFYAPLAQFTITSNVNLYGTWQ